MSDDVSVLLNFGDGTFAVAVPYGVGEMPTSLSIGDISQPEDGNFTFTISSDRVASEDLTVVVNTADIQATAGDDYTAIVNQTATITAGQTSTTVVVTVNDDAITESNETFAVNLTNARFNNVVDPNRVTIGDNQAIGTIQNNDVASLSIDDVSAAEDGTFTFTITSDRAVGEDLPHPGRVAQRYRR